MKKIVLTGLVFFLLVSISIASETKVIMNSKSFTVYTSFDLFTYDNIDKVEIGPGGVLIIYNTSEVIIDVISPPYKVQFDFSYPNEMRK